jgi:glycosyltransferase involved in cell wall biosynthesis
MNKGLARARGKWIYFIGSDDYFFSKEALADVAMQINELENAEFLYGNVWFEKYNKEYDGAYSVSKILGQNICHQAIFYKRTIFEKVGNFELKYPQLADYQFNLKCWFDSTINIKYVPITVCFFSIGGASTSQSDNAFLEDYPSNILRFSLESNFNFFKKITTTAACLRKIFIRYSSLHYCKSYMNNNKNVFILLASLSVMFCSLPYYFIKTKIFCHSK